MHGPNGVLARAQPIILAITILATITIAFAIYVFLLLKRRVVAPLELLEQGAASIEIGDYSRSVSLQSQDEIGALARAFNAMVEHVRERTSRLHATIESTTDGILVVDLERKVTTYNARFLKMWRLDPKVVETMDNDAELLAAVTKGLADPPPEQFLASIDALYANPDRADFTTLKLRDGRVLERYSLPQRLDSEIIGRVWSFRDVTERYQAAEQLRRREKSLQRTQSIARLGSWTQDLTAGLLVWSDELYRICGIQPQGCTPDYESLLKCVHPDDHNRVDRAYSDSLSQRDEGYEIEHRIVRKDNGEIRNVYQKCEHVWSESGDLIRSEGLIQDVTNRTESDERLRQLSQAVEQSPAAVIITDTDGAIEYVNPRFAALTGYTTEEVVGQNPRILKTGRHAPETYKKLWATIAAGKVWHGELCNQKKNGEPFWESVAIAPVKREDGIITHFVAVMVDITERKHDEVAIGRQNERLRVLQRIVATPEQSEADELQSIIRESCRLLGMERAHIERIEGGYHTIEHPFPTESAQAGAAHAADAPCAALALGTSGPVLEHDLTTSAYCESDCCRALGFQSYAGTRVRTSRGSYGVINFTRRTPRPVPFDDQDRDFLQVISGVIGAILDRLLSRQAMIEHTRELERFNLAMVNREKRMIELKTEVNALADTLDQPPPYKITTSDDEALAR